MGSMHVSPPKSGSFAAILETIEHGHDAEDAEPIHVGPGGHVRPDVAGPAKDWLLQLIGNLAASAEPAQAEDLAASRYAEETVAPVAPPPPPPRTLLPDDQDSVAAELALRPDMGEDEVRHVRRAFARANHPDRLLPEERERATRRMTIANMLIDQHLKQTFGTH